MKTNNYTIRPVNQNDLDPAIRVTLYGRVIELDGNIVAIGGVYRANRTTMSISIKPGALECPYFKRALIKACSEVMNHVRKNYRRVYADAQTGSAQEITLIEHYGFRWIGDYKGKPIYRWDANDV